jgi:hypothetical protein
MRNRIRKIARRLGITKKIGWHTFRQTRATLLRASGPDIKVAQELLRHASCRVTLDTYTQAVTETQIANCASRPGRWTRHRSTSAAIGAGRALGIVGHARTRKQNRCATQSMEQCWGWNRSGAFGPQPYCFSLQSFTSRLEMAPVVPPPTKGK